jgi:hypothetical protein
MTGLTPEVVQLALLSLLDIVQAQSTQIKQLQTLVQELQAKLGQTSRNSSKPLPSPLRSIAATSRSRTLKVRSRANRAFRQAAESVARSQSSFGRYFRAMRARLGPEQAIVATAHKIARVVYHLLTTK